jgi:hypothetical protein
MRAAPDAPCPPGRNAGQRPLSAKRKPKMSKEKSKGNKEAKKPKKEVPKVLATANSNVGKDGTVIAGKKIK